MAKPHVPAEIRFWRQVRKTESCWIWIGASQSNGYGVIGIPCGGRWKNAFAHRYSWILTNGAIPNGMGVLHRCDVPACVNPDHLFPGTHADNMADMIAKGRDRKARGEKAGKAKLTAAQIIEIRASKETQRKLGARYGVSNSRISDIRTGKTWQHV